MNSIHKPCPFCNGLNGYPSMCINGYRWGYIHCPDCDARGPEVRRVDVTLLPNWEENAWKEWDERDTTEK